jgi:putative NADPH-quinone reductase
VKASVLLAHPYSQSFNHGIFQTVCTRLEKMGVSVFSHDLYKEQFNPVLTVEELGTDRSEDDLVNQYAAELIASELLIFIHPNWWGQPPAVLKGYIDRVIRPPYAYDFPPGDTGGGIPEGKLEGKYGVVFNTSNTGVDREENFFKDPLETLWKNCIFRFCGIDKYYRRTFSIVAESDLEQRREWLREVEAFIEEIVGRVDDHH